ncbi:MAG: amino acid ABC transporter permease, partial [Actinomycetia bacterium]|nr:amino acid ABC transporter permease [Actinomycetes bacterium]
MPEPQLPAVVDGTAPPTESGPESAAPPAPAAEPSAPTAQRVIPLRHPWRWVATAVVLVLLAQVVHGL